MMDMKTIKKINENKIGGWVGRAVAIVATSDLFLTTFNQQEIVPAANYLITQPILKLTEFLWSYAPDLTMQYVTLSLVGFIAFTVYSFIGSTIEWVARGSK